MRLKLGRPDAPLTVTWAGVTTLLIDDDTSAVQVGRGARLPTLWQRCDPWSSR